MTQFDAMEGDVQTALVCTVSHLRQPVKLKTGDTVDCKFYLPDGTTFTRAMELVSMSPLLVRYRFLQDELIPGQWRFRLYLTWTSAGFEGFAQTGAFFVGAN